MVKSGQPYSAGYFAAAAAAGIVAAAHPDTVDSNNLAIAARAAHGANAVSDHDGVVGGGEDDADEESRAAFDAALARREARVREAHIQLRMRALKAGKRETLGIVPRRSVGGRSARSSTTSNGLAGLDASAWGISGEGDEDEDGRDEDDAGESDDDDVDATPGEGEMTGMLNAGAVASIGKSGGGGGGGDDEEKNNPGGAVYKLHPVDP